MPGNKVHDSLFGTKVAAALDSIPAGADELRRVEWLRKRLGPELGRRAARLAELRIRSKGRFDEGWLPFLEPKGFEQASAQRVAEDRARLILEHLGVSHIWDATCGIGADSKAAAQIGHRVIASDREFGVLPHARANLAERPERALVVQAELSRPPATARVVLIDPDRRPDGRGGRRAGDPGRWSPTLEAALEAAGRFPAACIKLPPAFDPATSAEIERLAPAARWSWTSLDGELREVALWSGELAPGARREARLLRSSGTVLVLAGEPESASPATPAAARAARWLAEADPAILRAGYLGRVANEIGFRPLDPHIAYLGGDEDPRSPWVRAWRVLGCVPLDRRRVRALLAAHDIGPVTVKKRGHPEDADRLARRFAGPGSRRGLLAIARLDAGHVAYLLDPDASRPSEDRGSGSTRSREAGDKVVGDEGFEPPTSSV